MYKKYEKLRDKRGVTDYTVSKETGITPSTFTAWRSGQYEPKLDKLKKISSFFGVPVTYFIE